ncbi:thiaminase II [Paraburkholderia aspalathi]|nr:thiaminase II [Paraburkholderia aspalathi]
MSLPIPTYSSKTFVALREAAAPEWDAYIDHAFVNGLSDGSLPKASFLHYLVQDYVYLRHYARGWALGVVKASTLEETRLCAATVHGLTHVETPLHVGICGREGISEEQLFNTEEAPENLSYTRFVLDAGHSGDFLDLLVALAPCAFGYGEIGLRLAKTASPDTPYREWIDTYAGDPFQVMCNDVGHLLDHAVANRIGGDVTQSPRWPELCRIFATATKLEADFWQMGLRGH